jgi:N-acetylglucosaminyl-diphospho-decaprenol L-rhamnosyltransferase
MKLLVVILNYRVTDLTIDCLHSLAGRVGAVPGTRVAVLENGTGGDAYPRLQRVVAEAGWTSWVDLSEVQPNRGFTGGNNLVIRAALASTDPPQYVLLLNADTLVHDRALESLVQFMDAHPDAGIAGSQMLHADGAIGPSPFRFHGIANQFDDGLRVGLVSRLLARWATVPPTPTRACRADWVSGAAMILRSEMLGRVGLLDEGLYTYYDDIDLCLRASRAGWETWYVPESRIVHLEGASTGIAKRNVKRRPAYWFQARRRFYLKNHGALYTALIDAAYLVGLALRRLRARLTRVPDHDPPGILGDSFRHSVFWAGFKLASVENPAMPSGASPAG